jgi:hypothetical protein
MPTNAQSTIYVHFSDKMTESLMNINKVIQDNKATLDSIQDMAVELTRAIRSMESAAIKYIRMADKVLETIVPLLKGLPIVGKEVLEFATAAQALAEKIVSACEMAKKVLPGVEAGLTTADMVKLKTSTGDVQQLTRSLQALMPASSK